MGIKRTAADIAFSDCIRESFDYVCAHCQIHGRHNTGKMDCAHVFSRKHRSTRWTVANALCLCRSCHQKLADRPLVFAELVKEFLGKKAYDALMLKHNRPKKIPKYVERDIAKHYRGQTAEIEARRAAGWKGYIPPEDWE